VAETLMAPQSFSSWGIRTIAETEARYNPMSYHNGSVWPHDTALIAMGFGRYGLKQPVLRLLTGLFDAARYMERMRLPELFCGFSRRPGSGPTAYPVACAPQAWSSASIFAVLGAALGISFDLPRRRICFTSPALPSWLNTIRVSNLRLGEFSADLLLLRTEDGVAVHVDRRDGPLEISLTT
jgi:glycogen debranching enzyme